MQLMMLLSVVAMTRPRRHLCIVGDSETVSRYVGFLSAGLRYAQDFDSDLSQGQSLPETVDGISGGTRRSAIPGSQRTAFELAIQELSCPIHDLAFVTLFWAVLHVNPVQASERRHQDDWSVDVRKRSRHIAWPK